MFSAVFDVSRNLSKFNDNCYDSSGQSFHVSEIHLSKSTDQMSFIIETKFQHVLSRHSFLGLIPLISFEDLTLQKK